jgi:hypothetical protein
MANDAVSAIDGIQMTNEDAKSISEIENILNSSATDAPKITPDAPAPNTVPGSVGTTSNFAGEASGSTTVEPKVSTAPKQDESPYSLVRHKLLHKSQEISQKPISILKKIMSKYARIVGYTTRSGEKVDVVLVCHRVNLGQQDKVVNGKARKTTVWGEKSYTLEAKSVPPTKVNSAILVVPQQAFTALANHDYSQETISAITALDASGEFSYSLHIQPFDDMQEFMTQFTYGILLEDEGIYETYIHTSKNRPPVIEDNYNKTREVKGSGNNGHPSLIKRITTTLDKDTNRIVPQIKIVHSQRTRITTKGNYIPMKVYDTIRLQNQYSADDANSMTTKYFKRYLASTTANGTEKPSKLEKLIPDQFKHFTFDPKTKDILKNDYFTTDASACVLPQLVVRDWYLKGNDGKPVEKNIMDCKVVKYNIRPDSGAVYAVTKELQSDKLNDPTLYCFDSNCKVAQAANKYGVNLLNYEVLKNSFASIAAAATTSTKSKSLVLTGIDIGALSDADIAKCLESAGL